MLKQRILTAVLFAVAFFLSLFGLGNAGFVIFISLVVLIGAWEWANLSGLEENYQRLLYSVLTSVFMGLLLLYSGVFNSAAVGQEALLNILLVAGVWWVIALLWVQAYPSSAILWGSRWVRAVMGWLILIPGWLALVYLHQVPQGAWLIVIVVLTVFTADTGAYIFGRLFGKRKLAAQVSPGKSWEGFFGGIFCTVVLTVFIAWQTAFASVLTLAAIIIPTALASVLGDLVESMVKRHRGIKDSGRILPGHGGMMDRLDSLSAAAPIFALGIVLSSWRF